MEVVWQSSGAHLLPCKLPLICWKWFMFSLDFSSPGKNKQLSPSLFRIKEYFQSTVRVDIKAKLVFYFDMSYIHFYYIHSRVELAKRILKYFPYFSLNFLMLSSPMAADYALHWHSLQLIVISYSGLWCRPDLKILFVNRPYLWSVGSLAGSGADKPSNSHLPLKRARGSVKFMVFKAPPLLLLLRHYGGCQGTCGYEWYKIKYNISSSTYVFFVFCWDLLISWCHSLMNWMDIIIKEKHANAVFSTW